MRLATPDQLRQIETAMIARGVSEDLMIETAGALAAREILTAFYFELRKPEPVVVLCGPGHNGADGLACARHLAQSCQADIQVWILPSSKSAQQERWTAFGEKIQQGDFPTPSLIIDAVFGIGLNREVAGTPARWVQWMNAQKVPIVSLDTPSGLDVMTGNIHGTAVRAHTTFTFDMPKPGFFIENGPTCVGRLKVIPLGFAKVQKAQIANTCVLVTRTQIQKWIPKKKPAAHKGDGGHCLVIAGSQAQPGCALLASEAASRSGAGYVTLMSSSDSLKAIEFQSYLLFQSPDALSLDLLRKMSSVVVGPGIGVTPETARILELLKLSGHERVIVDADAITVAIQEKLFPFPPSWIITPHPKEMARLLGIETSTLLRDRMRWLQEAQSMAGCLVLAKGYHSIVKDDHGFFFIPTGNVALAKAGSGDVLSGMIGGFLAQGQSSRRSLLVAAYLHGFMADSWVRQGLDYLAMTPQDLLQRLPTALHDLRAKAL